MENELYRIFSSINRNDLTAADVENLLKIFTVIDNTLVRNHLSMLFSDLKYDKAVPIILKKISDKKLHNNIGTLVYSLENLNAKKYFLNFIQIVCEQDYEARLMALESIEKYMPQISNATKNRALEILKVYKKNEMKNSEQIKDSDSKLNFIIEVEKMLNSK